MAGYAGYLLAA